MIYHRELNKGNTSIDTVTLMHSASWLQCIDMNVIDACVLDENLNNSNKKTSTGDVPQVIIKLTITI